MRDAIFLTMLGLLLVCPALASNIGATTEAEGWKYLHPAVFDWRFYVSEYTDLCAAGIDTEREAAEHWMIQGIPEGRRAHRHFAVTEYLSLNPDVETSCSGDFYCGVRHMVDSGLREGRQRVSTEKTAPAGECPAAGGRWSDTYAIKGIQPDPYGIADIANTGTGNVAVNLPWYLYEPDETQAPCTSGLMEYGGYCYQLSDPFVVKMDQLVRDATSRGIRPVGILWGVPEWARRIRPCAPPLVDKRFCIPDEPEKFGRFAAFVAWLYSGNQGHGRIDDFVIHNEVTMNEWWNTGCTDPDRPGCHTAAGITDRLDQYAANYNAAYDGILPHNGSAKVFYSLTHHFGKSFDTEEDPIVSVETLVQGMSTRVGTRKWRVAYHPYWSKYDSATADDLPYVTFGNIGVLVGWLKQLFPSQPWAHEVFLTESGFPVGTALGQTPFERGPWSSGVELQAQELCRSYETLLGTPGITNYVYHRLQDFPGEQQNIGLMNASGVQRSGWFTYFTANRIDLAPPVLLCGFENLPFTILKRGYHPVRGHWTTSRRLPPEFTLERWWKLLYVDAPKTRPLYECAVGAPGNSHNLPSLAAHCENLQPMGPLGFAYTEEIPGTIPLWRCNLSGDHFVTDRPDCEGAVVEDFLGWVFPGDGI
jgi:hypothetical protein